MQPTGKLPPFSRLQEGSWCASELDAGKTASRFRLNRGARPIGRVGGRCIKANENDVVISVTPTSRAFSAEECRESSVRRVVPVRGHVPVRARYVRRPDITGSSGMLVGYPNDTPASGCFTRENTGNASMTTGSLVCSTEMAMQASLSNSAYNGDSVQPEAARLLFAIKF